MPDNEPILELRSEPVQEIIGRDPNWLIRWGITVVFISVLVLLVGTWIIKYPEIVTSRIQITTRTPPIGVVARNTGKIVSLFIENGQRVTTNEHLAVLENTADYHQVTDLGEKLTAFSSFMTEPESAIDMQWNRHTVLGELQVPYSDFLKSFEDYRTFVRERFDAKKIEAIREQIVGYESVNANLESQKKIYKEKMADAETELRNHEKLLADNLISESDMKVVKDRARDQEISLKNAEYNIANNRIRIQELRRSILELEQQDKGQRRTLLINAQEAFKKLYSEYERWEQTYILKAPTDGIVMIFNYWSNNQYVKTGDEVMVIVPDNEQHLVGKIYLPQMGAGKVEIGQEVHIKFDSYPFREFGMVIGAVDTMSLVTLNNQYLINVTVPAKLETTYDKEIEFKFNMEGTAEIITQELRLIDRIFNQFRHLFKSNI